MIDASTTFRRHVIRRHKIYIAVLVVGLVGLLIFSRHYVSTTHLSFSNDVVAIVDALLAAVIVTSLISLLNEATKIPPDREFLSGELNPAWISQRLRGWAHDSEHWSYYGHTARFTRSAILPILMDSALRKGGLIKVNMQILDPFDDKVLNHYARYRTQARSGLKGTVNTVWTPEIVRDELLATILCLVELASLDTRFDVKLRDSNWIPMFRFDVSSRGIMVTEEDTQQAAYCYAHGDKMHDVYMRSVDLQWSQASPIEIPKLERVIEMGTITEDEARHALKAIARKFKREIEDKTIASVLTIYRSRRNPYVS